MKADEHVDALAHMAAGELTGEWQDTRTVAQRMFGTGRPKWWMTKTARIVLNMLADEGVVEKHGQPNVSLWRTR